MLKSKLACAVLILAVVGHFVHPSSALGSSSASNSIKQCELAFALQSKELKYIESFKSQLPTEPSVGPLPGRSPRELLLRFLSGLPSPKTEGAPYNTARFLSLWKKGLGDKIMDPVRWMLSTPVVLANALSLYGPFGPFGPLAVRQAPVGIDPGSPWYWWKEAAKSIAPWNLARPYMQWLGPLNPFTGILSWMGPDAKAWYQGALDTFGTNSVLGPKGPLGPLGPMGAVLTMRALILDSSGVYLDQKTQEVIASLYVPSTPIKNAAQDLVKYDIVNNLESNFSQELSDQGLLDTSFMVTSEIKASEKEKTFNITARNSETVSVLVVPDRGAIAGGSSRSGMPRLMNFSVEVLAENGETIIKSDLESLANMIALQVREGEKYTIRVTSQGPSLVSLNKKGQLDTQTQTFRLIVTGSTSYYAKKVWSDILGPSFDDVMNISYSLTQQTALNTVLAYVIERTYQTMDMVRTGQIPPNTINSNEFWKSTLKEAFGKVDEIKKHAGNERELQKNLLDLMKTKTDHFHQIYSTNPFPAEQIMHAYMYLWNAGPEELANHFNMTLADAQGVPEGWYQYLLTNYETLQKEASSSMR